MTPKVDISTLESHLWEAANILRGSPVDRTDWKSYILPLMFFKRICDVWDEEYQEAVNTCGQDFLNRKRKALILMATRTGNTRTTMGFINMFIQDLERGI